LATGSGSITALESEDFEFAWYRDSVTAALYGHWVKPILDGVSEAQEVSVTFEILRDGGFRDLRIDVSSGIPSLDRSALRAVADAAPFPPLPPAWVKPQLSARFRFSLDPE
jgi:TonB family protein